MIEAMVSGKLIRDAETKTSASGKPYGLFLVAVAEDMVCRAMLFGDEQERFAGLKRGDAIGLVGSLQVSIWNEKISLALLANRAISPTERRPKRERPDSPTPGQYKAAAHAQRSLDNELKEDLW